MATVDQASRDWHWQPLRELAGGGLLVMELMLAAFWFSMVTRSYTSYNFARVLGVLGVIFVGAYLLRRSAPAWPIAAWLRWCILLALLAFSLWTALIGLVYFPAVLTPGAIFSKLANDFASKTAIPLDFWVLLVVLLTWWRGLALAQHPVETDQLYANLLVGLLSLLLIPWWPAKGLVAWFIFLFIFVGLLSLGAVRIASLAEMRGGKETLATRGWITGLSSAALGVALLTVLMASIVRGWLGEIVVRLVNTVLSALLSLLLTVLYPVGLLVERLIHWLQSVFTPAQNTAPGNIFQVGPKFLEQEAAKRQGDVDAFARLLKSTTLWAVLIVILLAVLLAFGLKVYNERRRKMDAATTQLSAVDILRDLGEAARQRARELADELARRLRHTSAARLIQAARIRWIYAELMALCTRLKHPRQDAVTPLEFLPQMVNLFPDNSADLETITHAYLRVRYAEVPESNQEIHTVVTAWERIKALDRSTKP